MATSFDNGFYLKDETARFESFKNWPASHIVTPTKLASAGFFYQKEHDNAQCAYCDGIVGKWEIGDDPDKEHARHFPYCPYVQTVIRPRLDRLAQDIYTSSDLAYDLKEFGIDVYEGPKQINFTTLETRLESFTNWPEKSSQSPKALAEAGFFYTGLKDRVCCFSCGGGVSDWEPEDNPWVEHAKWYPKCNYVQLIKGASFVEAILKQTNEEEAHSCNARKEDDLQNTSSQNKSLEEENQLLKEARLCKVCMDNESNIIFLPCRHLVVCEKCAPSLKTCPVCRSSIKATVKTYFS